MRRLSTTSAFKNIRRCKLSFGICFIFYVIFVLNGYLKEGVLPHIEDESIYTIEKPDLANRRHNRNLQHLSPQEVLEGGRRKVLKTITVRKNIDVHDYDSSPNSKEEDISPNKNKLEPKGLDLKHYVNLNSSGTRNNPQTKRLPGAIIIGVKKGGTRALLEFLRAHPNVKATGPEPHFFDKNYDKGLEWYRNLMPESDDTQITIEKTPGYFITKDVPKRISKMSPSVKLIVVVRDPVTRAISDFAQIASKSTKPQAFESMVFRDNATVVDTSKTIVKIGMYAKHLERWLKYFPRNQFHFVSGENLIKDPGTEMINIQKFLQLPIVVTHNNFFHNRSRGFPCIKKKPNKKPHCLDETKGRKHPFIKPVSINALKDFYQPLNNEFWNLIGQEYTWS